MTPWPTRVGGKTPKTCVFWSHTAASWWRTAPRRPTAFHADLGKLRPGYQQRIRRLTSRKALDGAMRLLWRDMSPHARIAKGRIRALRELDRRIADLTTQIEALVDRSGTSLCDIYGVGTLVAATILAEVGNPQRYATKAKFAMANGTAPLEANSGRVVRHRLNRGGNRRLNRAIHTVALTQIARPDTEGRHYYHKLIARGKPTEKPPGSSNGVSQTESGPTSKTHPHPPQPPT